MMASETVLYAAEEGVARVTLNRPEALNAWTPELGRAYFDRLEDANADPEVRAIVLTGAGRGFCAGADFDYLREVEESGSQPEIDPRPQSFPMSLRKPVIAAINGPCAGLGFVMAMMCDIRFAARGAKLTTAFARRGLIAEYGLSWVLPRLAGASTALDLLLSGRTLLAEEALRLGVVDRLSEKGRRRRMRARTPTSWRASAHRPRWPRSSSRSTPISSRASPNRAPRPWCRWNAPSSAPTSARAWRASSSAAPKLPAAHRAGPRSRSVKVPGRGWRLRWHPGCFRDSVG